jgi:hypothetical protein
MSFDEVRERILAMVCPVHDIRPIVENEFDEVKVICCCKAFELICLKEIDHLK